MALTPEQVLNKHFQTTQFRRGYEERDVDDFLDEIVAEMRSLIEQRDDYLKQLNDCRASKNQPAVRSDGPTQAMPPVGRPGDDAKLGALTAKIQDAERAFKAASDRAAKAKAEADAAERAARERIERAKADAERAEAAARSAVDEKALNDAQSKLNALSTQVADAEGKLARAREQTKAAEEAARAAEQQASRLRAESESAPATEGATSSADAAGVIALAQRLHDEHVAAGEARRNQLVGEAEARHRELISTAQTQHDELTRKAAEMTASATAQREQMLAEATSQRDKIISEATAKRDEMLTEARERSTGMVAEAQQKKAALLEDLERQKTALDRKIEELRGFERNYRTNLKSYIEGQLHDLEGSVQDAAKTGSAQG
ncbi:MAG TPA: DivIVA domain-containing protein [Intrasporangium sp.]|uniref:DivIVA domain-containing protein n=1 Tax=Intrasporangium sp. TaxID=1925024 RepID=UPI002B49E032|nr:DivIVA domain-containing protein [Intrasporangium sp.]HKX66965.1 DivIVA domain-containing protein [Intrasporangium sp.]